MSGIHFEPGATPANRMQMKEFIRMKLHRLDENHTTLFLKKIQMEKDLENLKEQILMLEGAHQYLDQFLAEWDKYEDDTVRLRIAEETARKQLDQTQQTPIEEKKPRRKKKDEPTNE